jgi:hypothetical protein
MFIQGHVSGIYTSYLNAVRAAHSTATYTLYANFGYSTTLIAAMVERVSLRQHIDGGWFYEAQDGTLGPFNLGSHVDRRSAWRPHHLLSYVEASCLQVLARADGLFGTPVSEADLVPNAVLDLNRHKGSPSSAAAARKAAR